MPLTRRTFLRHAATSLPLSAAVLSPQSADAAPAAATLGWSRESEPVLLTLLHTNDLHGHVWHPGQPQGLVKLATSVQQARAEMPNVVLLDAGDIIHGTPEEKAFHGQPILAAMNALRYDVATVGNHEFDFGQKVLRDTIARAKFPLLSANVVDAETGKPWGALKPWTVITRGGVRIGVFGLTTPTTVQIEWPRTLNGIVFTDPVAAARKAITALRAEERVDVVIALSHLGFEEDKKLAADAPGMDLIIGGHSHTTVSEQVWVNDILIAQTGAHGRALGRIDLLVTPAKSGNAAVSSVVINGKGGRWWGTDGVSAPSGKAYPAGPLIKPTTATAEEAGTLAVYRPWSERLRPTLAETLTTVAEPLPAVDPTAQETTLGNLFADAIRAYAKTDIAFMSSSQISSSGLPVGAVTVGALYDVLGSYTRQHIVIARVPGAEVERVLHAARGGANAKSPYPVHLSGVTMNRDGHIFVGDAPLSKSRVYTFASGAHVVQGYFYQKSGVEIVSDAPDAPTVRDAVISFLRGHAPLRNDLADPPRWSPVAEKSAP